MWSVTSSAHVDTLSTIVDTFVPSVHRLISSPEVRESAPDSIQICEMMGDHSEPSSMLRFNLPKSPEITVYKCHMDCLQKVSTNVERSHRPPWPQPAAHAHASSADSMAGPPTAVGTATEAAGGNWDVCSGPDRSSVWKRPWAPKAACAQSCRVRLPGRIETRPGSTHIRITQISISRRD